MMAVANPEMIPAMNGLFTLASTVSKTENMTEFIMMAFTNGGAIPRKTSCRNVFTT